MTFNHSTTIFIPRRDVCLQTPVGVQLFLLMYYFVLGNVYWTLNLLPVFRLFETFKMFYPPKGLCKADTEGGPIVFTYVLFCLRKCISIYRRFFAFLRPRKCFFVRVVLQNYHIYVCFLKNHESTKQPQCPFGVQC